MGPANIFGNVISAVFVGYGLVCICFPRWLAKWDFHYNDRDNPSPGYLLRSRIVGCVMIAIIAALWISMYFLARRA